MIKNNIKKIMISLIAIFLVVSVACTTFATEGNKSVLDEINDMLQNETGNVSEDGNAEQIPEGTNNTNTNTGLNTNTNTNTNSNANENLPESIPYAGIGDYSGLIFVAILGISAVYAYKKVKEYNA